MDRGSPLSPLESAKLISSEAKDVSISSEGIHALAGKIESLIASKTYSLSSWKQHSLHPQDLDRRTVDWIFFIDLMNFSFWSDNPEIDFTVEHGGERHVDYWALCSVVRRALDEGIPILNAKYLAHATDDDIRLIFRSVSSAELSQLTKRRHHLNQAGTVLLEKFNGSFSYCVDACKHSAARLLELIVANFPSFRDEATFNGTSVSFYKRAQILIADLWACFENRQFGRFDDIEVVTMFADYRVPQVLMYHGVLKYSEQLLEHLRGRKVVDVGHSWELEIRGCTIWAVELVRQQLEKQRGGKSLQCEEQEQSFPINSIMIDFYLWDSSEVLDLNDKSIEYPMHRTRTIFY